MPYKDPEKAKEQSKIRMRRFRERHKEKKTEAFLSSDKKYRIEFTYTAEELTAEDKLKIAIINEMLKALASKSSTKQTVKTLRQLFKDVDENEDSFKSMLSYIPNMLSLGTDLQMLKHKGGTV